MKLQLLNKILDMISSGDEEMRSLGKEIFISNNPTVVDYLYMEDAVRLKNTDPSGFIESVERRLRQGYDILGMGHTFSSSMVKDPTKLLKLTSKPTK